MTGRVWDSIDQISDEQFLADDKYSRGSIRNLMVHLTSTDRRWLAGLKNQPDVGHLKFEDYPSRAAARELFESVAVDLTEYVSRLSEEELGQNPVHVSESPLADPSAHEQPRHRSPFYGAAKTHRIPRARF